VKVIVSAAKFRIFDIKKIINIFLQAGLWEGERIGLSDLAIMIKRINTKYSVAGPLSPEKYKGAS